MLPLTFRPPGAEDRSKSPLQPTVWKHRLSTEQAPVSAYWELEELKGPKGGPLPSENKRIEAFTDLILEAKARIWP